MTARTILHIGPRKTGSTFIQSTLWHNRNRLAGHGVLLPMQDRKGQADAARELARRAPGDRRAWARLIEEVNAHQGNSVVSSEALAGVRPEVAIDGLHGEIHVVIGARSVGEQLLSAWQQRVKERSQLTLGDYLDRLGDPKDTKPFWARTDPSMVAAAWARVIATDHIHVIVNPTAKEDPGDLWGRFAEATGLTDLDIDPPTTALNSSMSAEGIEALRLFNTKLGRHLPYPKPYVPLVRLGVAKWLATFEGPTPLQFPHERATWARDQGLRVASELRALGVDVVGPLESLSEVRAGQGTAEVTAEGVADALAHALMATTVALGEHRDLI